MAGLHPDVKNPSLKFIKNCEYRLFQRPDDAIHRGYDKKTESDFSQGGLFFSNYEPITRDEGRSDGQGLDPLRAVHLRPCAS